MMPSFYFPYLEQFFIALVLTSFTVLTHYAGMNWVRLHFRRFWSQADQHRSRGLIMVGIVAIMMATHVFEVFVWAVFYFLRGLVPSWFSAMYFSIASYTTLGESDIVLPGNWRGLGSFESMNAMLMYGWSTAVLAAVVVKLHSLEE